MSDQAKATAVKFFEEQDRLRGGPADKLCATGYTAHLAGSAPMGLAGHKEVATSFYGAIPDLEHQIEDVIAEDNRVAVRFRLRGTNSGSFMGHPPSGRPIDAGGLALMWVQSGKVTELRGEFDQLGLMQQIGALPRQ